MFGRQDVSVLIMCRFHLVFYLCWLCFMVISYYLSHKKILMKLQTRNESLWIFFESIIFLFLWQSTSFSWSDKATAEFKKSGSRLFNSNSAVDE